MHIFTDHGKLLVILWNASFVTTVTVPCVLEDSLADNILIPIRFHYWAQRRTWKCALQTFWLCGLRKTDSSKQTLGRKQHYTIKQDQAIPTLIFKSGKTIGGKNKAIPHPKWSEKVLRASWGRGWKNVYLSRLKNDESKRLYRGLLWTSSAFSEQSNQMQVEETF